MTRQLLVVASENGVATFLWDGRRCRERVDFSPDDAGLNGFRELLEATGELPVRVAFDSVDEEFQFEVVPRVMGSARAELLQRRRQQAFMNPAYSVTVPQGRAPGVKHSEQVLFAALTDSAVVDPWLEVIAEQGVPLVGVYSASQLSVHLYRLLDLQDSYALLLFRQATGKLRQSYFASGKFRVSRLTRLADGDPATLAERYLKEAEATRQFLASAKLMPRTESLHVHILHRPEVGASLEAALGGIPDITLHLHNLAGLPLKLGVPGPADTTTLDGSALVAHLLGRSHGRVGNYATTAQCATHRLYKARRATYGAAAAAALGAVCLAGWQLSQGVALSRELASLDQQNRQAEQVLQHTRRTQRTVAVLPADMKAVVETAELLDSSRRVPERSLKLLGQALSEFTDIELTALAWRSRPWEGDLVQGMPTAGQAAFTTTPEFAAGTGEASAPGKPEWLKVSGRFTEFDGDYRAAHHRLEALVEKLRSLEAVVGVAVTTTPLNVDPTQQLTAKLGSLLARDQRPTAPFEFTVTLDHG